MNLLRKLWSQVLFGTGPIEAVQQAVGLGYEGFFEWITLLGGTWGVLLVMGVAAWLWEREDIYALLGAIALAALSKELMSMVFSVSRPSGPSIVVYEELEVGSFPSGHVYQILVPWGVLYARDRLPLLIPVLVATVVGFSRLYLGVHYLADVLFAFVFGAGFVWLFHRYLWPPLRRWLAQRSQAFYLALSGFAVLSVVGSIVVRLNNARRWEILGLVVGTCAALFLWERLLPDEEAPLGSRPRAGPVAAGLAGFTALLLADQLAAANAAFYVQGLLFCAATVWVLLAPPVLFRSTGKVHTRRS